jgi:hypothetical protein
MKQSSAVRETGRRKRRVSGLEKKQQNHRCHPERILAWILSQVQPFGKNIDSSIPRSRAPPSLSDRPQRSPESRLLCP